MVKTDHLLSRSSYDLALRMEAVLELHLKSGHSIIGASMIADGEGQFYGYIFYSVKA